MSIYFFIWRLFNNLGLINETDLLNRTDILFRLIQMYIILTHININNKHMSQSYKHTIKLLLRPLPTSTIGGLISGTSLYLIKVLL